MYIRTMKIQDLKHSEVGEYRLFIHPGPPERYSIYSTEWGPVCDLISNGVEGDLEIHANLILAAPRALALLDIIAEGKIPSMPEICATAKEVISRRDASGVLGPEN